MLIFKQPYGFENKIIQNNEKPKGKNVERIPKRNNLGEDIYNSLYNF